MISTLLVTGATGCVGRAVTTAARAAGWRVRGLARRTAPGDWEGHELVNGDVTDAAAVARAALGCQAVVHLAGWVHRRPASPEDHRVLRAAIVDGTGHVAEAARQSGATLVSASTVAVYGAAGAIPCDDQHAVAPETPYARAKLEAEAAARARHPSPIILRLALVYGPHDRGNFLKLVRAIDRGYAVTVGAGENRKSVVCVTNVADRILGCLQSPETARGTWIVADGPAPSQRELMEIIAGTLGRRAPLRVPEPLVSLATGAVDRLTLGRLALRDRARKLTASTEFLGTGLDERIGYRPRVSLEEGIRRTVAWYRQTRAPGHS
jgi:nucleoside-diphosphate-sugar epimerase